MSTRTEHAALSVDQRSKIGAILRLLDQVPTPAELQNRRGAPRLRVRIPVQAHLLGLIGCPSIVVYTRNISTRGIGCVSRRPFRQGEYIALDIDVVPSLAKVILCQVTFSRYLREGLYEVGAEFQEAVARAELLAESLKGEMPPRWIKLATGHGEKKPEARSQKPEA